MHRISNSGYSAVQNHDAAQARPLDQHLKESIVNFHRANYSAREIMSVLPVTRDDIATVLAENGLLNPAARTRNPPAALHGSSLASRDRNAASLPPVGANIASSSRRFSSLPPGYTHSTRRPAAQLDRQSLYLLSYPDEPPVRNYPSNRNEAGTYFRDFAPSSYAEIDAALQNVESWAGDNIISEQTRKAMSDELSARYRFVAE